MTVRTDDDNSYATPPKVSGAISQHTPSYWRLALPALGVRYVGQAFETFLPGKNGRHNRLFDALSGAWMFMVTGWFAARTANDMKNVFAETIAYETGKDPATVGYTDLFKSDNNCVTKARRNMVTYNLMRAAANSTFFLSFSPVQKLKNYDVNTTHLGVGINSVYLFGEVVLRNRTFFEMLQNFVDTKLNQQNALGEDIKPIDLLHLYERNAIDNDPGNAFRGQVSSEMWKDSQVIFQRMTDLMNHTYQDKNDGRQADFTLPKFLYMLGHNLIQPRQVDQTLAYIEVANSYGIDALKKVIQRVQSGDGLSQALKNYPVTIPTWQDETPPQEIMEFAPKGRKHVNGGASRAESATERLPEKADGSFVKRYGEKPLSQPGNMLAPE